MYLNFYAIMYARMKKIYCLLLLPFLLSACALNRRTPTSEESSNQSEPVSESKEESELESISEEESEMETESSHASTQPSEEESKETSTETYSSEEEIESELDSPEILSEEESIPAEESSLEESEAEDLSESDAEEESIEPSEEESILPSEEESEEESVLPSEEESVVASEEESVIESEEEIDYPYLSGDRLLLNPYGDYVTTTKESSSLPGLYSDLCKTVKSSTNGVLQSVYQKGLVEFFNYENKVDIKLNISRDTLEDLQYDHETNNKESFRACSVDISYLDMTFHYEEVGIRQKGNTSRGSILNGDGVNSRHYKLSFEETFDDEFVDNPKVWNDDEAYEYRKDREFFGLSKIDFRWNRNADATYMKEYYAFEMYRGNDNLAARTNPVHFMMNVDGEVLNHGVYLAVETITKSFIKRNFVKSARNGDLYKLSWGSGQGAKFNPVNDDFFGVETQYRNDNSFWQRSYTYELKTNKDTSTHEAIKTFISVLNEQHGNTAYEFANQYMNYQQFLTYASISYLLGDPDDLRSNYNNAYIYFTGDTNQMYIIPIDNDRVLGASGDGGNPTGHHGALCRPFDKATGYGGENDSNLFNKLIFSTNSTTIRPEYITRIGEIIDDGWMSIDKFREYYDVFYAHYKDDINLSSKVHGQYVEFSINESTDIYSNQNLSAETYMNTKVQTYNDNK